MQNVNLKTDSIFKRIGIVMMSIVATCMSYAADMEMGDSDEIGCSAKYKKRYLGYLISADGLNTNATASVSLSQRAKNGVATATMEIQYYNSKSEHSFYCGNIHMPESVVFLSRNNTNDSIRATVTTYAIVGTYKGQRLVLSVKNGDGVTELKPLDAVSGYWTFVTPIIDKNVNVLDVTNDVNSMFAAFSIQIKKKGRTKVVGYMPDGWKVSKTFTIKEEADRLVLPVYAKKSYSRGVEVVAFNLCFYKDNLLEPVLENGEWFSTVEKDLFERDLSLLSFGLPNIDKKEVRKRQLILPVDQISDAKFTTVNDKSGILKGSFVHYVEDARGKLRRKRGTINGVAVDGICYGVGCIKNLFFIPVVAE